MSILGIAYKGNVNDSRCRPSKKIIKSLLQLKAKVISYDPFCKETSGAKKESSLSNTLKDSDCLVIVTAHSEFRELNLYKIKQLTNEKPIIIDGRRIINPIEDQKLGFLYFGIGYKNINSSKIIN